jgi:ATP-binding cassette, subfamily A (ABC1), member 3
MLTRETHPTMGRVYIGGRDLSSRSAPPRHTVGYCPQHGGLTLALSGREVLSHFAAVRGLPPHVARDAVLHALSQVGLTECADQQCGQYSGGNRRRLSVAVALIGAPLLLLLDEPTTGMDPAARKGLGRALQAARAAGQTIVLTSHMMEEADAFCTQVGP